MVKDLKEHALTIRFSDADWRALARLSAHEDVSVAAIVRKAIREYAHRAKEREKAMITDEEETAVFLAAKNRYYGEPGPTPLTPNPSFSGFRGRLYELRAQTGALVATYDPKTGEIVRADSKQK